MAVEPVIQAEFERNLAWKRSWPRCFLSFLATLEILIGLVIFLTEIFNIIMEFWHMNVFGGIWASIIIFINWILLYVTACCTTTVRASTCSLIWNIITLLALGVLIAFDIIFILNPYTCILTDTCSTQPQVISLNSLMQMIPPFKDYSSYDSKKFFLEIQVGCAGVAFIISLIYVIIFIVCRVNLRKRVANQDYVPATAPLAPPLSPQYGLPVAQPPPASSFPPIYSLPVAQAPPWSGQKNHIPYAPY